MTRDQWMSKPATLCKLIVSNVSAGQTVVVTTGTAAGHTHLFTFLKLA